MTIINVFQSNDQNIVVLVEGMFHSILHFVYHVIVFNFYLRKIVLQEVWGGGIIFKRELIWNEWFIFIFIDIYNNWNNFKYIFLLFLNFTKIL